MKSSFCGLVIACSFWSAFSGNAQPTRYAFTTIAGQPGFVSDYGADGTNSAAHLNGPYGLALDRSGNLYVADCGNNTVRKLTRMGTNWVVTSPVGPAAMAGSADGTNGQARFSGPYGIATDNTNLYVADSFNNTIRKATPYGTNWVVSTLAGQPGSSASADGAGTNASFASPSGIAADSAGNLFVADFSDNLIRWGWLPPTLQSTRCGHQVVLSWPSTAPDFLLETASTLSSKASWQLVTQAPHVSEQGFILTNKIDAAAAFYRLRKQ